jgi:hypothetical protein
LPKEDDLVIATAEEIVGAFALDTERTAYLRRRLQLALYDLGLIDIVGRDWVLLDRCGVEFNSLSFKATDRLVRALEDLARQLTPERTVRCVGQLALPDVT